MFRGDEKIDRSSACTAATLPHGAVFHFRASRTAKFVHEKRCETPTHHQQSINVFHKIRDIGDAVGNETAAMVTTQQQQQRRREAQVSAMILDAVAEGTKRLSRNVRHHSS